MSHQNGPPKKVEGGPQQGRPSTKLSSRDATYTQESNRCRRQNASQQVDWWSVHEFVAAVLDQVNGWPTLGTPAWCSLANDDPQKWAALLDGAQHHALRLELNQQAECQASRDISAAADWSGIAQQVRQHNEFYAAKPWLRRLAS